MSQQHRELAAGGWNRLSFAEQMGNIGSEVERALSWRTKQNPDYSQKAFERALELVDLTLENAAGAARLREVARMREAMVDFFMGSNEFASTAASWKGYFSPFAYAARRHT